MSAAPLPILRPAQPEDRAGIVRVLLDSRLFGESDAACVGEMFDETWAKPRPDGYRWVTAWIEQTLVGFACHGAEALTQGTWDLFWVCVLPEHRGRGVGRALVEAALAEARREGARLMVIYTSSTTDYAPARRLYESAGFVCVARVPEYYRPGDDLCIYWRRLDREGAR